MIILPPGFGDVPKDPLIDDLSCEFLIAGCGLSLEAPLLLFKLPSVIVFPPISSMTSSWNRILRYILLPLTELFCEKLLDERFNSDGLAIESFDYSF
jgi:hypothetical protein